MTRKFHFDEAATERQLRALYAGMDNCSWDARQIETYIRFSLWILNDMADGVEPDKLLDRVAKILATMTLAVNEQIDGTTEKAAAAELLARIDHLVFDAPITRQNRVAIIRIDRGGNA